MGSLGQAGTIKRHHPRAGLLARKEFNGWGVARERVKNPGIPADARACPCEPDIFVLNHRLEHPLGPSVPNYSPIARRGVPKQVDRVLEMLVAGEAAPLPFRAVVMGVTPQLNIEVGDAFGKLLAVAGNGHITLRLRPRGGTSSFWKVQKRWFGPGPFQ